MEWNQRGNISPVSASHRRAGVALRLFALFIGYVPFALATEGYLAQRLDSLFAALPHARFEWASVTPETERAALRLPVDLDGTSGWFQLDTGLDVTLLYGSIARDRGWVTYDGMYRVPSFEIGDISVGPVWLRTREETDTHE